VEGQHRVRFRGMIQSRLSRSDPNVDVHNPAQGINEEELPPSSAQSRRLSCQVSGGRFLARFLGAPLIAEPRRRIAGDRRAMAEPGSVG
jgi:hypothetical protein